MTMELREGQRFARSRGFARGPRHPFGLKWWLAGVSHKGTIYDKETGENIAVNRIGAEHIEIVEIVSTRTFGMLAFYRQWVTDPDGVEVALDWVPKRREIRDREQQTLRRSLAAKGFTLAEAKRERPVLKVIASEPLTAAVH